MAITLCRLQNLFISILVSELFDNLRRIPLPRPLLSLLAVVEMEPSTLYTPAQLYYATPLTHSIPYQKCMITYKFSQHCVRPCGSHSGKQAQLCLPKASVLVWKRE